MSPARTPGASPAAVVRAARHVVLVCGVLALGGCALKPWVAPYERDLLAEPAMSFDRDPASGTYMHHVHGAREGARGAEGGGGGGCGCS